MSKRKDQRVGLEKGTTCGLAGVNKFEAYLVRRVYTIPGAEEINHVEGWYQSIDDDLQLVVNKANGDQVFICFAHKQDLDDYVKDLHEKHPEAGVACDGFFWPEVRFE